MRPILKSPLITSSLICSLVLILPSCQSFQEFIDSPTNHRPQPVSIYETHYPRAVISYPPTPRSTYNTNTVGSEGEAVTPVTAKTETKATSENMKVVTPLTTPAVPVMAPTVGE